MLESTAPGWTELVNKMQAAHATALAEARAEGRRQGLEEAAKAAEAMASRQEETNTSLPNFVVSYPVWALYPFKFRECAAAIRSLATNTPETQKPETGESRGGHDG